jgi:Flp pilus assembly protein TadB
MATTITPTDLRDTTHSVWYMALTTAADVAVTVVAVTVVAVTVVVVTVVVVTAAEAMVVATGIKTSPAQELQSLPTTLQKQDRGNS